MWDGGCAAANTKQAKAALAGVQKKLGQMEDAVIRLTGEKDALAHRMKVGGGWPRWAILGLARC